MALKQKDYTYDFLHVANRTIDATEEQRISLVVGWQERVLRGPRSDRTQSLQTRVHSQISVIMFEL